MVDGIRVAEHTWVVALDGTIDATIAVTPTKEDAA
jgi:hypothetical protein